MSEARAFFNAISCLKVFPFPGRVDFSRFGLRILGEAETREKKLLSDNSGEQFLRRTVAGCSFDFMRTSLEKPQNLVSPAQSL